MVLTVALHAVVFALAWAHVFRITAEADHPAAAQKVILLSVLPPRPVEPARETEPELPARAPATTAAPAAPTPIPPGEPVAVAATPRRPASMPAPPAPTAEEWAFAGSYRLKNSKAYRYTWGQQVRSLMGTAVEGPDQGMVRFRVEIAPDGHLARLETLWSTSPVAERRARQAIEDMPRWPPTPTGQPLVFERTIAFTPYASDIPPLYKDDCLPDPPAFRNPFTWDGSSDREPARATPLTKPDPQALEECLGQLPQDSIEAESAHDQRQVDRWGSSQLGR